VYGLPAIAPLAFCGPVLGETGLDRHPFVSLKQKACPSSLPPGHNPEALNLNCTDGSIRRLLFGPGEEDHSMVRVVRAG
jgi:hypothetical protein